MTDKLRPQISNLSDDLRDEFDVDRVIEADDMDEVNRVNKLAEQVDHFTVDDQASQSRLGDIPCSLESSDISQRCADLVEYINELETVEVASGQVTAAMDDDEVFGCARDRLINQIHSFLRDPEFADPYGSSKFDDDAQVDRGEYGAPGVPLSANDGHIMTQSSISNDGSQDNSNKMIRDVRYAYSSSSSDIYIDESTDVEGLVKLLFQLKDICCEYRFLKEEVNLDQHSATSGEDDLNTDEQILPQIESETSEISRRQFNHASEAVDHNQLEKSMATRKEDAKLLLLILENVVDKQQFSSASELEQFLQLIEELKLKMGGDSYLQEQRKLKRESESDPEVLNKSIMGANSLSDAICGLRTKLVETFDRLSPMLVTWQEFNEVRAELKYEFRKESQLLKSIDSCFECDYSTKTIAEVEHDLFLIQGKQETYDNKLRALSKYSHQLSTILDADELQDKVDFLVAKLLAIKDSCSDVWKKMGLTQSVPVDCDAYCTSYSQTETPSANDDDYLKQSFALLLFKVLLLLLLFMLICVVVFYFKPLWCRTLNRFRLPAPFHLRHVGTYPPF